MKFEQEDHVHAVASAEEKQNNQTDRSLCSKMSSARTCLQEHERSRPASLRASKRCACARLLFSSVKLAVYLARRQINSPSRKRGSLPVYSPPTCRPPALAGLMKSGRYFSSEPTSHRLSLTCWHRNCYRLPDARLTGSRANLQQEKLSVKLVGLLLPSPAILIPEPTCPIEPAGPR